MSAHSGILLLWAAASIALLVGLAAGLKLNPFLALLLAALALGIGAGMEFPKILVAFQNGLGATLGSIAGVIGFGVMLGKLLAQSGGADVLARRLNAFFGAKRVGLCIMTLALTVGLTTWFAVGLFLLAPILMTLTRETGRPYLMLAIPLISCLSVMHGLMPPHPGPVIAVEALKANTGLVLLWGAVIGLPTAAIAGPIFARWASRRLKVEPPQIATLSISATVIPPPFGLTLFSVLLPVALMLLATIAELALPQGNRARSAFSFIGNPTMALALSVLFALWSLGGRCGYNRSQLLRFTEDSVASAGMTLLVVGAGGGFARVLREAGVAEALGDLAHLFHLPPLLYAWMVAAFIRVATGSATVSITAASGLLAPLLAGMPGVNRELLVICIGCGSLFLSHLNDGGFWIVKDYLGLTLGQTLRTWTVTETIIGIAGLLITLAVDAVWRAIHF
jgi:gluconate:H+ symporter, GntP family